MTETKSSLDPQQVAKVRSRLRFITVLWWIAALFGTFGLAKVDSANIGRWVLTGAAWLMAFFFSYAWLQVRKDPSR